MLAICSSMFLVSLDRTIIATSIPTITNYFRSFNDIAWYGSAYLLTGCVLQLPLALLYKFFTPKWVFISMLIVFEIGSAVCGGAQNSVSIIVGRAIQGLGGAGIFSGSMVLIVEAVPLAKRPMYMGFGGATFGLSAVLGPLVGGALTSNASWRWCFLINLPIGGMVLLVLLWFFPNTHTIDEQSGPQKENCVQNSIQDKLLDLDPMGIIFLVPGMVSLMLALQWGGSVYTWSNGRIIALFVVAGILSVSFILNEIYQRERAMLKMSVFTQRTVVGSFFYSFCVGGSMMTIVYYLPIWFQAIKGASAVKSGEMNIPLLLSLMIGTLLAGMLVSKVVRYAAPFMIAGAIIMTIGAGLFSTFGISTSHGKWIGYQVVYGFGLGLGMQQGAAAIQAVIPKHDTPQAISFLFFGQQLGVRNIRTLLPNIDPGHISNSGATDFRNTVSGPDMIKLLQAYNCALRHVFFLAIAVSGLALAGAFPVEWKNLIKVENEQSAENDRLSRAMKE
ncbi:TPA_exp: Uncharacterized protein A8136_2026 [Trichophyton benhamiae CBS 112371]|nr:TPA_exp: Uncharacterized protein A8136_2026 [Trichophyton benhamiae CBS 112371]